MFRLWTLIAPKLSNHLVMHENFTTITRLQGEHNPTNFYWKQTLDEGDKASKVATIKM